MVFYNQIKRTRASILYDSREGLETRIKNMVTWKSKGKHLPPLLARPFFVNGIDVLLRKGRLSRGR